MTTLTASRTPPSCAEIERRLIDGIKLALPLKEFERDRYVRWVLSVPVKFRRSAAFPKGQVSARVTPHYASGWEGSGEWMIVAVNDDDTPASLAARMLAQARTQIG